MKKIKEVQNETVIRILKTTNVSLQRIDLKPIVDIQKSVDIDWQRKIILEPVSYTHLDVYKRQNENSSIPYHVPEKSHFSRLDATHLVFR